MRWVCLSLLLCGCSGGNDPRTGVVVVESTNLSDAASQAIETWRSAGLGLELPIQADCDPDRACFRIRFGGAPDGAGAYALSHELGDCEISTAEDVGWHPMWRLLAHELGHCLGLEHTTAGCGDGARDLMNHPDYGDMELCEPAKAAYRALYP